MVKIESQLGQKNLGTNQKPMRTFSVSDESEQNFNSPNVPIDRNTERDDFDEVQPEIKHKDSKELGNYIKTLHTSSDKVNLSPLARKNIEILANLGRAVKDVKVDNITFSIRTLKSTESRKGLIAGANSLNNIEAMYIIRDYNLAQAIYAIDGQDIGIIIGKNTSDEDYFEAKLAYVSELEEAVVSYLHSEFDELVKSSKKRYTKDEVKEVVEDLKKSS